MQKDALYAAAIAGDADATAALEMHAHKLHGYNEETILHTESEMGNTEHVQFILRKFAADKNLLVKLNKYKETALHLALSKGYTEVAEILIGAATHLLPNDDNNPVTSFQAFLRQADKWMKTALHYAVRMGNVGLVKLIVEADPTDSHTRNGEGETPMYIAAKRGYYNIVKMICTTCTAPLDLDAPGGRTTILHTLLNNADPEKEDDRNAITQITEVIKNKCGHEKFMELLDRSDEKRCIILELAVKRDFMDMVELILAQLAVEINYTMDIHSLMHPSESGGTFDRMSSRLMGLAPLIYEAIDKENSDMLNLLSRSFEIYRTKAAARMFNPSEVPAFISASRMFNLFKVPAFISAIRYRQEELVSDMLKDYHFGKLLVTFADNLGWTALHHAAYHEFDIIIPAILKAQKEFQHPFVYPNMLSTPFHVAAAKGHTSTVICLMQSWPPCSSAYTDVDKNEQNILHLAALQSKKEMVQGILKYCSEEFKKEFVNKQDNNGDTPLHILIRRGCFIPELLRYEGLDMRVENNKRWTPPDMLYFDEKITDDQVQIKIVLDDLHPTKNIFSNSVPPNKRMRKDNILNKEARLRIDGKHTAIKEDTDAIAKCFADAIAGDAISIAALKMKADKVNELGETILHVESKRGDIENVGFIVSEFANKSLLGKLDGSKQTALHLAAHGGHIQVVEALIDAARLLSPSLANDGAHTSVDSFQHFIRQANVPNRNTALHLAVLHGNVAIVKLLVEADPNDSHVQNSEGKTPIYIAAEKGRKDIIKVICTSCKALSLDGPGGRTTALHALIQNIGQEGENNVIGTMVDAAKSWSSAQNTAVVGFEELFSRKDESERTILQLAVERNDVSAVKLILQQDPANQPGAGEIKRHGLMRLICKAIDKEYSAGIVKLLSDTYISGIINHDPNDVLALILAIQKLDKGSVLRHLKDAKHLVNYTEDNGWTPLHYAVYHEFDAILDAIIKAQKEVGHQFAYGNSTTPFHVAVKYGYTSTLIRLMELWPASSSASVDANSPYIVVDEKDRNILHLAAAAKNRKEMVKGILEYCPDKYKDTILEQQDIMGDTPLHLLFSNGCFTPELIKRKGLNTMARNKKDLTPRDMLYVEDAIVEDQVHIKIALDHVQNDQSVWKFWGKRAETETDIWGFNKTLPSKRKKKDLKFEAEEKKLKQEKHDQRKDDLERYKNRTNTQILVTALITTVTFTVGFTMPGGLHQSGKVSDEGLAVLSRKRAFNVFMLSDALALLMSTSSLFFYFLESMNEDPHQVSLLNASSTVLNILSIIGMMLTFIAGTYVVLSDTPVLALAVCIIGSLFFFLILIWIIKMAYDRWLKEIKD
ncbi:hypothetical protein ACET3Z_005017 [Daucus carota]